jgi:hypothetical protein
VVHPAEVLVFLVALGGWWRQWRNVAWSFALALLGTIQVFSVGDLEEPGNGWLHGLHGGLVIFVVALAAYIARREPEHSASAQRDETALVVAPVDSRTHAARTLPVYVQLKGRAVWL